LTHLHLYKNQLTGPIPSELGDLKYLQFLHLNENQLEGPIPSELGTLPILIELDLQGNQLEGEIPPELGDLANLKDLLLYDNQLSGTIPSELGALSSLTHLLLHSNQLSGEIPSELSAMPGLLRLYLNDNQLSGSIPTELGALPRLIRLHLHSNQLSGEIPSELGALPILTELHLHNNQLSGSIPSELGDLANLKDLLLYDNQLSGTIPSELGNLDGLTYLYLHENQLTGSIPPELGSLRELEVLLLHNNRLTGEIPSELGDLSFLSRLRLHGNQLTGTLPARFSNLSALVDLSLDGYMLKRGLGSLPESAAVTLPVASVASDEGLSARVRGQSFFVRLPLPSGADAARSSITLPPRAEAPEVGDVSLPPHDEFAEITGVVADSAVEMTLDLRGDDDESVDARLPGPAVVCVSVPSSYGDEEMVLLKYDGEAWEYLDPVAPPAGYDPGAGRVAVCGSAGSFSLFIAAVVKYFPFSGIDPSPASMTVSPGEAVRMSFALRGLRADGGDGVEDGRWFDWADGDAGGSFRPAVRYDEMIYTAPEVPGTYTVTVSSSADACLLIESVADFEARCTASLAVTVAARSPILRIEPSISSLTLSPGDFVTLSFDVYGRQGVLDNGLGAGRAFVWGDGDAGGSFRSTDRPNAVIYTAPAFPGTYAVVVSSPAGACFGSDDFAEMGSRCTAEFAVTVRRPMTVSVERPAPQNPIGEIPAALVDAEGRQYAVFTPEDGGSFDGGSFRLSVGPGAVSNLEIVGLRVAASGPASNAGSTAHRYRLFGDAYDVLVVDAGGSAISSYVLHSPAEVCVPLPAVARRNISDVALVARNADATLTILSAKVRITGSGVDVCGSLGSLPASVAVGVSGAPDALPTPVTDADEIAPPDTGGGVTAGNWLLPMFAIGVFAIAAGAWTLTRPRRRGAAKR
jgi:Leucine-rich repeat (LRR) protein